MLIVDTGEITNQNGIALEPAANIVQPGDYILEVNGKTVSRKRELIAEIEDCQGENVELVVNRKGEEIPLSLEPVLTQEENYKLGIWVRDNTQGIGTMTYVDEKGRFGALGHGISDTGHRRTSGCIGRRTLSGPDRFYNPGSPRRSGRTFWLY